MDVIKHFEPFFGDWYAESFIGAGSFGRVYRICREELGQRFYSALKYISIPAEESEIRQLRLDGMDDDSISTYYDSLAQDINSEITLMNRLKGNTNIVSFEDSRVVRKPGGIGYDIFIRMELLESLTNRLLKSALPVEEVVKLGKDVCSALTLCAKNRIIHRDIKPDNIFVSPNGDYKLGDFGIARQLEKTATFMSKKGTYNYMAPEVYKGEQYGATCDIYSLGLVMYRLLNNGRLPFLPPAPQPITPDDREKTVIRRMKGEPFDPPKNGSEALNRIVLKACAFAPEDRYQTAEEMHRDLFLCSTGERDDAPALKTEPKAFAARANRKEEPKPESRKGPAQAEPPKVQSVPQPAQRSGQMEAERKDAPEPAPKPEKPADRKTADKGTRKKLLLIVAAAALAVIAAVVLIVVLAWKGKSAQQAEPTPDPFEAPTPDPFEAPTPEPEPVPESSVIQEWDWLLKNGVLTISGKGNYDPPLHEDRERIRQVVIEDGITGIGSCAFIDFSSLKSITIPSSVTSIGDYAFCDCSSLKDVYFKGSEAQWKAISIGEYNDPLQNATIHYNSN